jgi:hypothetical protein
LRTWLVLHDESPEFLTERFFDQLDAIRLLDAEIYQRYGWEPASDTSDLRPRQRELKEQFGSWVTQDWWGVRPDGRRIGLSGVVKELSASRRFHPRMAGEQPVLRQHYELSNKFAAQCLHHTGVGFPVRLDRGQPSDIRAVPYPSAFRVLSTGYWTFAQLVYLVLDVQQRDFREFETLFLDGLFNVFGRAPEMELLGGDG